VLPTKSKSKSKIGEPAPEAARLPSLSGQDVSLANFRL